MGWFKDRKTAKSLETADNGDADLMDVTGCDFGENFRRSILRRIYGTILNECADRSIVPTGVKKESYLLTCFDSYAPFKQGLISIVVEALIRRQHVFYRKESRTNGEFIFSKVTRLDAVGEDGDKISPDILELNFQKFHEAEALGLLIDLLGDVLKAMSKGVTVSQALVLKLYKLSEMIDNDQNLKALRAQLKNTNEKIRDGKAGVIDSNSEIDFMTYDSSPAEKAINLIFSMCSMITGLPKSYIFGEVVSSIGGGDSGDSTRENAAVKRYYYSVWGGVLYTVYDKAFEYKQPLENFALFQEVLSTLELTDALTPDAKKQFLVSNFNIDETGVDFS
ncbi:TPA: hypothetical protein P0E12_004981 [Vibrio harveyi]|nr:hypothetical protein [Vibrio harveyi]